MTLQEKIDAALKEHDEMAMNGPAYKTPEAKAFIIEQVHYAVNELLRISKKIREVNHLRSGKDWRVVANIQDEMVAFGQRLSSFLWLANLREKIVDQIEHTYGIGFSGLRIHGEVFDKADGKPVYVLYNPRAFGPGPTGNFTLAKDGELFVASPAEFDANYTNVKA